MKIHQRHAWDLTPKEARPKRLFSLVTAVLWERPTGRDIRRYRGR